MTEQITADLEVLSQLIGVPSREQQVSAKIREMITLFVDEIKKDALGNLIGIIKGSKEPEKKLMLDAHLDEIGFIIRHISKEGFLYFSKLGGFVDLIFPGQTVVLAARNNKPVYGVIGIKPPHMIPRGENLEVPKAEELAIDIGASSLEEVNELGIEIGTTGTLAGPFRKLANGRVLGKAFDDRTGCVVLIETIRRLAEKKPPSTIIFNFASAEEVGGRGATTAAYSIEPDMALALENTTAGDTPGVKDQDCPCKLDHGPAITVADRSLVPDYEIVTHLKKLAEENQIPWQYKKPLYGGTDAGRIAITRGGVRSAVVSVPCRYIHSPISLLVVKDIERTCDLVEAFCRSFQELL
jgi:endoglucanase